MVKILVGIIVGAVIGYGANYLCMLTGGACPLMKSKITSIIIWVLIGGMVGVSMNK